MTIKKKSDITDDDNDIEPVRTDLEVLDGVGKGTVEKLNSIGIFDIADLAVAGSADVATAIGKPQEYCDNLVRTAGKHCFENNLIKKDFYKASELAELEENQRKMHTGSKNLDNLLEGGIAIGEITEFYAGFGSGKTQLCFTLATIASKSISEGGLGGNTLYIDTENTFSGKRVKEIIRERGFDPNTIDTIFVKKPKTASYLELMVKDLSRIVKEYDIKLIILDSLTALHRQEFTGREHLADRQHKLAHIMSKLNNISTEKDVAIVVTNQILQNPGAGSFSDPNVAAGGTVISHATTHRFKLFPSSGGIKIQVKDSPRLKPSECLIQITEKGIEDHKDKKK